jgi:hypothetical protein
MLPQATRPVLPQQAPPFDDLILFDDLNIWLCLD